VTRNIVVGLDRIGSDVPIDRFSHDKYVAVLECVAMVGNCTVNKNIPTFIPEREWGIFSVWFIPDFEEEYFCFILDTKKVHVGHMHYDFAKRIDTNQLKKNRS
jgi:hypothetical protein